MLRLRSDDKGSLLNSLMGKGCARTLVGVKRGVSRVRTIL